MDTVGLYIAANSYCRSVCVHARMQGCVRERSFDEVAVRVHVEHAWCKGNSGMEERGDENMYVVRRCDIDKNNISIFSGVLSITMTIRYFAVLLCWYLGRL